jgi:hypothetical protein
MLLASQKYRSSLSPGAAAYTGSCAQQTSDSSRSGPVSCQLRPCSGLTYAPVCCRLAPFLTIWALAAYVCSSNRTTLTAATAPRSTSCQQPRWLVSTASCPGGWDASVPRPAQSVPGLCSSSTAAQHERLHLYVVMSPGDTKCQAWLPVCAALCTAAMPTPPRCSGIVRCQHCPCALSLNMRPGGMGAEQGL